MQLKDEIADITQPSASNGLGKRYTAVRNHTEDLCKPLKKEDYVPQPAVFASPPKWHLAHTTWFFEEMILKRFLDNYEEYDPKYNYLFNSYYESAGERVERTHRGSITRPTVDEVLGYRTHVDRSMFRLIKTATEDTELYDLIILGLNHEQQHQELLLTDLKYAFGLNPTFPVYLHDAHLVSDKNQESGLINIQSGLYEVGHSGEGFCYDNELGRHKVFLNEFEISKGLVTNGEFIQFIEAGGYEDFRLWLDDGWNWVNDENISAPQYWRKVEGEWHQYTLGGLMPVDKEAILAHISFYEAYAYASWKGMRLPTEFEWEAAAGELDWGKRWEWTYSAYLPYPGFKIAEGAVGEYNGKFMINQMVLRGSSTATPPGHSRPTYRNFFHPDCRWQFTGIRLVK